MLLYVALVSTLAAFAQARAIGRNARIISPRQLANTSYDFVIAGGGIAGLTVADRLTENPNVTVLVLEYGPFDDRDDGVTIPGAYFPVPYLWLPLPSTPQKALNNNTYTVTCARVVGGGSVVNAMFWHRSSAIDYDAWETLGATGRNWDQLLPYFKKSETFTPPNSTYDNVDHILYEPAAHGFDGPVQASFSPYDYPADNNFWDAALYLNVTPTPDANGGDATGIFQLLRSVDPKTETRSSARINHYDRVIASRPNYHVLPGTAAQRVLFENTTAVGVEFVNPTTGEASSVLANREVIVAAGSVHSPQILQLSGIGPAEHLESLDIPVISNLPGVGQNLQDHLVLDVSYNYTNGSFPNGGSLQDNATYAAEQRALYDAGKPSAYDITATTGNLFVQLPLSNYTSKASSIIALAQSQDPAALLGGNPDATVLAGYKAQRELIINNYNTSPVGDISWDTGPTTSIYMTRPLSRGSVVANSTSILDQPLIDFGAATDPTDIEVLLAIYLKNRDFMATPQISPLGPIETSPAPGVSSNDTTAIKEALKASLTPTNAHQCGTNVMAPRSQGGVVDPQNLVYGTQRLSVVDASVFPFVPAGGPQASVYGMAEMAADIIKQRHGLL